MDIPKRVEVVVDAWNKSDFILVESIQDPKNNRVSDDEIIEQKNLLAKIVEEMGVGAIKAAMAKYFEACDAGLHLFQGRNNAYKNLIGFIRRLRKLHQNPKVIPWWGKPKFNDPNPKLTQHIADSYAKRFLGRKRYNLKETGSQYSAFAGAGDWITLRAERTNYSEDQLIKFMLDEVEERWGDGGWVSPSKLILDVLWTDYIPQRIKRMFGG